MDIQMFCIMLDRWVATVRFLLKSCHWHKKLQNFVLHLFITFERFSIERFSIEFLKIVPFRQFLAAVYKPAVFRGRILKDSNDYTEYTIGVHCTLHSGLACGHKSKIIVHKKCCHISHFVSIRSLMTEPIFF